MSWILGHQDLHITIGSVPRVKAEGRYDLNSDLQMIKASILYADHAKLCSFSSASVMSLLAPTDIPESKRLDFLREVRTWPLIDQETKEKIDAFLADYEFANRRRHSKRGKLLLRQFHEQLSANWLKGNERMRRLVSEMGGDGIVQAVGSGLLEVHEFGSLLKGTDSQAVIDEYLRLLGAAVSEGKTYPLFDESTGRLISSGIASGTIAVSDSGVGRSKEVALAADLLVRLPLFPQASVKEVLDIRRELEKPLLRFRAAMITFSEKIKDAAWDKDFSLDAERVFSRDVAPAILDLEDEARSIGFVAALASHIAEKALQLSGVATGSIALSGLTLRMSNLPLVGLAALSIGPILAAAGITYSAYQKWRSKEESAEQNNLFFYHQAARLLEDGTYQYVSDKP